MRNFFKNNDGIVFEYDDKQVAQGYGKDMTPITEAEMQSLTYVEPVVDPKAEGDVYSLNGVDYLVPFMKDDADGLLQVNAAFQLGITDSVLYFTNGTKMPITAAEFQDFAVWFVTKRNSFFTL